VIKLSELYKGFDETAQLEDEEETKKKRKKKEFTHIASEFDPFMIGGTDGGIGF